MMGLRYSTNSGICLEAMRKKIKRPVMKPMAVAIRTPNFLNASTG
jgi:hypothetical protein